MSQMRIGVGVGGFASCPRTAFFSGMIEICRSRPPYLLFLAQVLSPETL